MCLHKLYEEARSVRGMIAEIACKARLLEQRVLDGADVDVDFWLLQMRDDLAKYSQRLTEIFEESGIYA